MKKIATSFTVLITTVLAAAVAQAQDLLWYDQLSIGNPVLQEIGATINSPLVLNYVPLDLLFF